LVPFDKKVGRDEEYSGLSVIKPPIYANLHELCSFFALISAD